jgi:ADP-ribose pyrophosphatase YjhB (NUDIX family)
MLKKIVGKIWSKTPGSVRLRIIRLTQKKFTASVAAVITNKKQEILLLDHVFRPFSNWGLPGGFIETGEQPEDAIEREIFEETGLKLENIQMFRIRNLSRHIEILYTAESKGIATVKSREINGLGWFRVDEMPENMSPVQKAIIKKVLDQKLNFD